MKGSNWRWQKINWTRERFSKLSCLTLICSPFSSYPFSAQGKARPCCPRTRSADFALNFSHMNLLIITQQQLLDRESQPPLPRELVHFNATSIFVWPWYHFPWTGWEVNCWFLRESVLANLSLRVWKQSCSEPQNFQVSALRMVKLESVI